MLDRCRRNTPELRIMLLCRQHGREAMADTGLDISEFVGSVGKDFPQPEQFNYEVNRDVIRHFARAIPDGNALYLDGAYASDTRWRGIVAPPGYLYAHGSPAWLGKTPGIRDAEGRELTHVDNATEDWEFLKPVRPGDTIYSYGYIEGAEPKLSRKLGPCVLVNQGMRYTNQYGELVAKLSSYCFRFRSSDVAASGKVAGSYPQLDEGQFTRNVPTMPLLHGMRPVLEKRYDSRRFFEDVEVGEELPELVLGPIMASDMAAFNAATNGGGYDRIGRHLHIPDAFAPGEMRILWFGSLLTRWGGPNSWVTRIRQRNEEWVLVGFKVSCRGRVTGKRVEAGRPLVEVDVWVDSELGFRTNSGTAEIELESREHPALSR